MSELRSTGIINIDTSENTYLFNNFTLTKSTSGWTLGGSLDSNGVAVLTGTAPTIQTTSFSIATTDIIVFEFTVSVPTPSTTTSGPGLYLGTQYGVTTTAYWYDFSNKAWGSGSSSTNCYFIHSYNSTAVNNIKTYILGSEVDIADVPAPTRTQTSHSIAALKVPNTTTYIRSGYNSNTSMVIYFSNPKIYKINRMGLTEELNDVKIGKGWLNTNQIIEY